MIDVTCAIIRNEDNKILVVRRGEYTSNPLKWEFPGGKIKKGETGEECIIREINEELSIGIVICRNLQPVEYDYGDKQIRLIPFVCDTLDELPLLSEHVAFEWMDPGDLRKVDFSPADILVAEEYLMEYSSPETMTEEIHRPPNDSYNEDDLRSMINNMMGIPEAEWLAESAVANSGILRKLIDYSFSQDRKLAFRASWTLSKVFDRNPELLNDDLPLMIKSLDALDNESVQRSFLRMISLSDLNRLKPEQHGLLADHCFRMLRSGFAAIAIKAYSMEIIYRLAVIYPDLANELSAAIALLSGEGSAGIIARGRIILRKLAGSTKDH